MARFRTIYVVEIRGAGWIETFDFETGKYAVTPRLTDAKVFTMFETVRAEQFFEYEDIFHVHYIRLKPSTRMKYSRRKRKGV